MELSEYKDVELIHEICKSVGGPISIGEALFLYSLAKECKDGVIVDIGTHYGLSTICLASGSKAGYGVKVYSIDPHMSGMCTQDGQTDSFNNDGIPDIKYYIRQGTGNSLVKFRESIKKFQVEDIVVPIVDYSELAYKNGLKDEKGNSKEWDLDIGLLFIDGDHRFNYVKLDIQLWAKHVINGGKILFHDYPFPGVCGAINELIIRNPRYYNFRGVGVDPIVNVTVKDIREKI